DPALHFFTDRRNEGNAGLLDDACGRIARANSWENDMSDQDNIAAPRNPPPASRGRGRVALFLVLAALGGALAGGLVTDPVGQMPPMWHMRPFMGDPFDPANVDRRVERVMKHLAVEADATAEQQAKLVGIAKGAVGDLLPLREKLQANRAKALDLFTAGT